MKKLLTFSFLLIMLTTFSGCWEKEEASPVAARKPAPNPPVELNGPCGTTVTDFLAGQHILAGNITVTNDQTNLYVTYTTTGSWQLQETHLYVGSFEGLPKTSTGNPKIGNFPYKDSLSAGETTYTYTVPLSSLGDDQCFVIAAHASVVQLGPDGEVTQQQTAWGAGNQFNESGSWATYSVYCLCDGDGDGGDGSGGPAGGIGGN